MPQGLRRPMLIMAFSGCNDAAESATTAARYLAAGFDAEKFAEIDPEEFYHFGLTRPYVRFKDESQTEREIVWPVTEFSISQSADLGRDIIVGDDGPNHLDGSGGGDRLQGCEGDDAIDGNYGTDTALYGCSGAAVAVDLTVGTATGQGTDQLLSIENVGGSSGQDVIMGDTGPNVIAGSGGADSLSGGGDDDVLKGGAGIDTGDGGPHVNGDTCLSIEIRVDCELGL